MSKTIGIFGGAFDPVHIGHSKLVLDIQKIIDFEKNIGSAIGESSLQSFSFY